VTAAAPPVVAPGAVREEAGLVTRIVAFALDVVVIDVAAWVVGGVVAIAVSAFDVPSRTQHLLLAIGAAGAVIWAVGYFVFFWSSTGQTPGNRVMQIRVRDASRAAPLSGPRSLLRVAGALLSAVLLFTGFALIAVEPRRRGLHDLIAGSVVVYAPRRRRRARPESGNDGPAVRRRRTTDR
jgi:uncharacterized RDD family membrane protein YckC